MAIKFINKTPLFLVAIHSFFVLVVAIIVGTSNYWENRLLWLIFFAVDFPISLILIPFDQIRNMHKSNICLSLGFLVVGGLWWYYITLPITSFFKMIFSYFKK